MKKIPETDTKTSIKTMSQNSQLATPMTYPASVHSPAFSKTPVNSTHNNYDKEQIEDKRDKQFKLYSVLLFIALYIIICVVFNIKS